MKTIYLISLIGLITILSSCKETGEIKVSEIANVWRLEEIYINGQLQVSNQMPVTHLGIQEDNKYFRPHWRKSSCVGLSVGETCACSL